MITQDQLKDVLDRADSLFKYLDIDRKKIEYEEEDLRTQAPELLEAALKKKRKKCMIGTGSMCDPYMH